MQRCTLIVIAVLTLQRKKANQYSNVQYISHETKRQQNDVTVLNYEFSSLIHSLEISIVFYIMLFINGFSCACIIAKIYEEFLQLATEI